MRHDVPSTLRAHSGDARLLARLHAGPAAVHGTGTVHSVFARVVNLLAPDGLLVALASRDAGDAPRTLVVDIADWTAAGLRPGHDVTFTTDALLLDTAGRPLRVGTDGARPWDPVAPALTREAPGTLARAARTLDAYNRAHGARG
ncbi:hypothetical protein GTW43_24235, partial [Streptomyces sp. SID5785]|uniref:hypothetical protein n=1 Tax=Streptomyces sp. SID5785 TaxID=2690309 RepID=UPI0013618D4E